MKTLTYKVKSNGRIVGAAQSINELTERLQKFLISNIQIDGELKGRPLNIQITAKWIKERP